MSGASGPVGPVGPEGPAPSGEVVDARGLRCPAPVIRLARAAKDAAPGAVVTVWWTDPAARHDIPAWARMRGHEVLDTVPLEEPAAGDAAHGPAWATRVRLAG